MDAHAPLGSRSPLAQVVLEAALWIACAGLVLYIVLSTASLVTLLTVFPWVAHKIAAVSGMSPPLALAIAVPLTAVGILGAGMLFSFSVATRRRGFLLVASAFTLYFGLAAWATRNANFDVHGNPVVYVERDVTGALTRSESPINRQSGERNERITPALAHELARQQRAGFTPVAITAETPLFDQSGRPLLWYAVTDGVYECFSTSGKHPRTGVELQPLTADAAAELIRRTPTRLPQRVPYTPELALVNATDVPILWFSDTGGIIELWDAPGVHPQTGQRLGPVTAVEARRIRSLGAPTAAKRTGDALRSTQDALKELGTPSPD